MPLYILETLIQLLLVIHVFRTGRPYYWMWIIIFFPVIGCLAYFFVEIAPEMKENMRIKQARNATVHNVYSSKRLKDLEKQVEITPSFKNKKALADGYLHAGHLDLAIDIYEDCRHGVYQNNTALLENLAKANFFKGNYKKSQELLLELNQLRGRRKDDDFDLLLARTYEELGDNQTALDEYTRLIKGFSGEEARCRYALLLKKNHRNNEAQALFEEIKKNIHLSPKYYKQTQKKWLSIAMKESV